MATTVFHKMHGLGNDFVLLDLRRQSLPLDAAVARRMADRRTGIGFDQMLVLRAPAGPDDLADFEIWNADGSRAKHCGNGTRCIGLYLVRAGEAPDGRVRVKGPVSSIEMQVDGETARVDMGQPDFRAARVPILAREEDGWYVLEVEGDELQLGAVSMGNPHAVMLTGPETDIARLGPALSLHPAFPDGCNVGFAEVLNPGELRLRVHERGAGWTRACGTGACAAAAVLRRAGLLDARVRVVQDGGTLEIEWGGEPARLLMTGPAAYVFEGKLE